MVAGKKAAVNEIDPRKAYEEFYTLRVVGGGISTSIPKTVIERKAKEAGITVEEFINQYGVVMLYDNFTEVDGAFKFVRKDKVNGKNGKGKKGEKA